VAPRLHPFSVISDGAQSEPFDAQWRSTAVVPKRATLAGCGKTAYNAMRKRSLP